MATHFIVRFARELRLLARLGFAASLLFVTGCARDKAANMQMPEIDGASAQGQAGTANSGRNNGLIVTPSGATKGKVAFVNPNARYVVLTFPLGSAPPVDSRFSIYRGGLKVGEVKVTGPQMDNNTVGDITVGEASSGDEVRSN